METWLKVLANSDIKNSKNKRSPHLWTSMRSTVVFVVLRFNKRSVAALMIVAEPLQLLKTWSSQVKWKCFRSLASSRLRRRCTTSHWEQGDKQSFPVDSQLKGFAVLISHLWRKKETFSISKHQKPSHAENNIHFFPPRLRGWLCLLETARWIAFSKTANLSLIEKQQPHRWLNTASVWSFRTFSHNYLAVGWFLEFLFTTTIKWKSLIKSSMWSMTAVVILIVTKSNYMNFVRNHELIGNDVRSLGARRNSEKSLLR